MKKFYLLCFSLAFATFLYAQERTITGRVSSTEDGSTLPGVNVVLKGTSIGTTTNATGQYSIAVPASGGTLVFTFIGYKSIEIAVGQRSVVDVSMETDVTQLSEVVVSALGIETDAARLGTATSKIGGSSAKQSGEAGLIQGLAGKASGVLITKTAGDPGAGAYIQIRGQSSITSSLQPLIVVDGVPVYNSNFDSNTAGVIQQSRMNDLNPDDIESIQVLKGASAGALWGSRAANGVIMITTKKGSSKGARNFSVSYGATYSIDQISYKHKLQTTFGKGLNGVWNGGTGGAVAGSWGDIIANRPGGPDEVNTSGAYFEAENGTRYYPVITKRDNTNYEQSNFDQVFQNGSFFEQTLSISGGGERGSIYASFSTLGQEGIIRNGSDYDRTTFRINAESKMSDYLTVRSNFSYAKITSNRIQQGSNLSGLYLGFLRTPADFDNRDYKGTYYNASGTPFFNRHRSYRRQLGDAASPIYNNPGWTINEQQNPNGVDRFIGSMELEIKPESWLKFIFRPGVDFYEDRRRSFFPINSADNAGSGLATEQTISEKQLNLDMFGMANFKLSDRITGTGLIGMNFNERSFNNIGFTYQNFILDLPISSAANATNENTFPFDAESILRTSAGYATLNLGYDELLYVNATMRVEAASSFGSEAQSTFSYPSVDVAFNFTELAGLKNNNFLSLGKLRAAYGEVGIQPGPYQTKDDYVTAVYFEGWGPANSSAAFDGSYARDVVQGNNKLKPERKKEFELGTDLGFLNKRINLGFTYYQNKTVDAIFQVGIAPSTGYSFKYDNAASLENKGFEVDLSANLLTIGDFAWDLNANFNRNRNNVLDLRGTESLFLAGFTGASSRAVEGQPLGVLWGGKWDRDDNGNLILSNGFPTVAASEGIVGDPNPDWRGGLGTTFKFKGLRLYALFETFQGGDMWAGTHGALYTFGRALPTAELTTVSAADAATIRGYDGRTISQFGTLNGDGTYTFRGSLTDFGGGQVALSQAWYRDIGGGFGPVAEQFIVDGSWTRLRELTLSYTLSGEAFRKATKLTAVDFTLTGRNLAIWAPAELQIGVDPETNLTGPSNGRGLEYFNNPGTKSFLFSIRLTY